ncbi:glycosyltransferase [Acidithiobacillus thiooxidans]|uniref:glycosyltransferase family 2 protein n=1 Tax=Acidithiobacillus TaxID=119977 RepID=UPI00187A00A4|nr:MULTISPECIES: glycosyltransferase [Acidithiobacillus]MBE7565683.1 glycosyltransferase [Acidithiobacillus sp. HP-11]MBU2751960.1 glycosyltransferase [Acidithiobacillus thiooxidans]MBU2792347.1 glycosyltransferase [Acidithiobacillus thiooxidans]
MDGQNTMSIYGNKNLPEGTPVRPLVTFALFAYNQEKYIREAVVGALSQTYSPLEIILSDDCSSDRTFEIMDEMARAYDGPHLVRVVKTDRNLGGIKHYLLRGTQAMGEIVIEADGDDISKPDRCAAHVPFYEDPSVMAVTGAYDLIDEDGNILMIGVKSSSFVEEFRRQRALFKKTRFPYVLIHGATTSYRKKAYSFPMPPLEEIDFPVDIFLSFLIHANGYRVGIMPSSFVMYRMNTGSLTNFGGKFINSQDVEIKNRRNAIWDIQKVGLLEWLATELGDDSFLNRDELAKNKLRSETIRDWTNYNLLTRFKSLVKSVIIGDRAMTKWKFVRLLGRFPLYQPKSFTFIFRGR